MSACGDPPVDGWDGLAGSGPGKSSASSSERVLTGRCVSMLRPRFGGRPPRPHFSTRPPRRGEERRGAEQRGGDKR
ncbi:hypothetical protein Ait01nite_073940 [Actinoplanes italicus]|uniref:Uncharacterized protein n=1 Tax=Actinoplanes italicus TaxID=113567 RepID=A0A2T0K0G2_9ACTN|nr:hypothetical protein [Actinoplanes italicus]PRX16274.1 hypothetical protein CLV67_12089 [Actinoplanes italicus]GIE34349.1 hypothetical protein Ait01nite_073940 [Actinoplanes italicus]